MISSSPAATPSPDYLLSQNKVLREKGWHTGIPHYGRVRYKDVYAANSRIQEQPIKTQLA